MADSSLDRRRSGSDVPLRGHGRSADFIKPDLGERRALDGSAVRYGDEEQDPRAFLKNVLSGILFTILFIVTIFGILSLPVGD